MGTVVKGLVKDFKALADGLSIEQIKPIRILEYL